MSYTFLIVNLLFMNGKIISYWYTNDILECMQMNLASRMCSSFSICQRTASFKKKTIYKSWFVKIRKRACTKLGSFA